MKKKVIFIKNYLKHKIGDIALCKSGFIRNFLIPQEKALMASEANIEKFKNKESEFKKKEAEKLSNFLKIKDQISEKVLTFKTSAYSNEGKLYGSIKKSKILSLIQKELGNDHKNIISSELIDDIKIKELGSYDLKISLNEKDFFITKIDVVKDE